MRRFKTYLTEIKNNPDVNLPDDWDDPFKRTFLDRLLHPDGPTESPAERLRSSGFDPYTGKEISDVDAPRPSAHRPYSDKLKDEIDGLRQAKINDTYTVKNIHAADAPDDLTLHLNEPDPVPDGNRLSRTDDDIKDAIKRATDARNKRYPKMLDTEEAKKALRRIDDMRDGIKSKNLGFTKDDIKQLEAINNARDAAAAHVDDVTDEMLRSTKMQPDDIPKKGGKIGKQLDLFHTQERAAKLEKIAQETAAEMTKHRDAASHSISRMKEWEKLGKPGSPGYEESMLDPANRSKRAATIGKSIKGGLSRVGKVASNIMSHPVTRGALKTLAVAGTAYEAGSVGKQIHDVGGLSRHTDRPELDLARQGYEDIRPTRGRLELDLPDPFGGYGHLPYAEKRKRQKELAGNIRGWEETPTTPKVTRQISHSTLEKFRTDPELQRELIQNIGAGPYSDEDIIKQIQKRTRARTELRRPE